MTQYKEGSFYDFVKSSLDNKVDKVAGKGLSQEDFNTTLKNKLDGVATGATANDTDSNLKNRSNHTGSQAISTVTGLQTELDNLYSRLSAAESKLAAIGIKKTVLLSGTTDSAGKITFNLTSHGFATAPKLVSATVFNNDGYSLVMNTLSVSTTSAQVCFLREKNTPVLLGGNITPSEPLATQSVTVIALEF